MPIIRIGDINIYYELFGQGGPLLLMMGLSGNLLNWGPVVPARLAFFYQVMLFDNHTRYLRPAPLSPGDHARAERRRDALVPPENGRLMAERIPNAQPHEIEGAGHVFWISHPDTTAAALAPSERMATREEVCWHKSQALTAYIPVTKQ